MGKVILCTGKDAIHPYTIKSLNKEIRSLDELCYLLGKYPAAMAEEVFETELYDFIETELGLLKPAQRLRDLKLSHAGAKDIMVTIFCSGDYFGEQEIKEILAQYDVYYNMKPVERKKKAADRLLKENRKQEAALIYLEILDSEDVYELSDVEYGKMLHNVAVLEVMAGDLQSASGKFREAYERNHCEESLQQYLISLKLLGKNSLLDEELRYFLPRRELIEKMHVCMYMAHDGAEQTGDYKELERLRELYDEGRIMEYYQGMDELLERLKSECRNSMKNDTLFVQGIRP